MSFLQVSNIRAAYGKKEILHDVSFQVEAGQLVGILGANGSGKSTLLKSICGILPSQGTCMLEGIDLGTLPPRKLARLAGYIPQRSGISIDISAMDVVLMGFNPRLGLLEHPSASMRQQAADALQKVGLAGKEEQNYRTLSEGQKQLCILARTLCSDARLLLLDEPESALDFRFRYQMLEVLRHWVRQETRCALVALHDPSLAFNCCDQLLLLDEGRICHKLSPKTDSLTEMEDRLKALYGSISLHRCTDRKGNPQILMIKEDDE